MCGMISPWFHIDREWCTSACVSSEEKLVRNSGLLLVIALAAVLVSCSSDTRLRVGDGTARNVSAEPSREVELPTDGTWSIATLEDKTLYVVGMTSDTSQHYQTPERYLLALDVTSGETLWRSIFKLPPSGVATYNFDLRITPSAIVYRTEYTLSGLSREDGSLLWEVDNNYMPLRIAGTRDDALYVTSDPNKVRVYNTQDGNLDTTLDVPGYQQLSEAWLTVDGSHLVAQVISNTYSSEIAVVAVPLNGDPVREVLRTQYPYDGSICNFGPIQHQFSGTFSYDRSDYVVLFSQLYERVKIEAWNVLDDKAEGPAWTHEMTIDPNQYTAPSCYAPNLALTHKHILLHSPNSTGLLLNNILRLQLHDLQAGTSVWTNIVPSNHVVDAVYRLPDARIAVHTRYDQGEWTDRWHVFDLQRGDVVWSSNRQSPSGLQLRWIDANEHFLIRLMTTDWINSRLLIDTL